MSYLVLARKWRPQGFEDIIGQEPIMHILKNALSQSKISTPIYSQGSGVGKTTTARILAKALNCKKDHSSPAENAFMHCDNRWILSRRHRDRRRSNNSVDDIRDLRERSNTPLPEESISLYHR